MKLKLNVKQIKRIQLMSTQCASYYRLFTIVLLSLLLFACESISYYSQSVVGHSRMMLAREPLDTAIDKAQGKHKEILQAVKPLRQFAIEELSLPDNGSYLSYVDLKREFPVWSVVAAPEFSVSPVTWCYPVIGCAAYRGYFAKHSAEKYAKKLQKKQLETVVGGVSAYSTLGWFADPLLPTMFQFGKISFMQLMFHELAHQQLYVNGNSSFNEAFATVVGEHGTLRWLERNAPNKVGVYQERMAVRNDFSSLLKSVKLELADLYAKSLSDEEKRQQKEVIFSQFKHQYEQLIQGRWNGKKWYSAWFKKPVNNARLAAFSTYRDLVPAFEALLADCQGDFALFYEVVASQKGKGKNAQVPEKCSIESS